MNCIGTTTIYGRVEVGQLRMSKADKPYVFLDVHADDDQSFVGLVVFGQMAEKLSMFPAGACTINLIGRIETRKCKEVSTKMTTGLCVLGGIVTNGQGDSYEQFQADSFVAFRS